MPREGWRTRLTRWLLNLIPAWRGTGAWVTHIAPDWSRVEVRLPLSWRTRNYVGTIFGGSMYGATDPVHMLMLIKRLGSGYEVWDKAARIRFRRPGRSTLYARFELDDAELVEIRRSLEEVDRVDRVYHVDLVDSDGVVHAEVEKTVHIRRR